MDGNEFGVWIPDRGAWGFELAGCVSVSKFLTTSPWRFREAKKKSPAIPRRAPSCRQHDKCLLSQTARRSSTFYGLFLGCSGASSVSEGAGRTRPGGDHNARRAPRTFRPGVHPSFARRGRTHARQLTSNSAASRSRARGEGRRGRRGAARRILFYFSDSRGGMRGARTKQGAMRVALTTVVAVLAVLAEPVLGATQPLTGKSRHDLEERCGRFGYRGRGILAG